VKALPGKPDIVFQRVRVAIFVHGCFWHQHAGCIEASKPRTNVRYWRPKLASNVKRDALHGDQLKELGYNVLVFWECEIEGDPLKIARTIGKTIRGQPQFAV
jgi:DNA mismatch endonuclease (patch repair protein)